MLKKYSSYSNLETFWVGTYEIEIMYNSFLQKFSHCNGHTYRFLKKRMIMFIGYKNVSDIVKYKKNIGIKTFF